MQPICPGAIRPTPALTRVPEHPYRDPVTGAGTWIFPTPPCVLFPSRPILTSPLATHGTLQVSRQSRDADQTPFPHMAQKNKMSAKGFFFGLCLPWEAQAACRSNLHCRTHFAAQAPLLLMHGASSHAWVRAARKMAFRPLREPVHWTETNARCIICGPAPSVQLAVPLQPYSAWATSSSAPTSSVAWRFACHRQTLKPRGYLY